MAHTRKDLRKKLRSYQFEFDLLQKVSCSAEENTMYAATVSNGGTLPEGVFAYDTEEGELPCEFYTICETDLTEKERKEYLALRQLRMIRDIHFGVMFFTWTAIISAIITIIYWLVVLAR